MSDLDGTFKLVLREAGKVGWRRPCRLRSKQVIFSTPANVFLFISFHFVSSVLPLCVSEQPAFETDEEYEQWPQVSQRSRRDTMSVVLAVSFFSFWFWVL